MISENKKQKVENKNERKEMKIQNGTIGRMIVMIMLFINMVVSAWAQVYGTPATPVPNYPVVPYDIVTQGRQKIVSYLAKQVDHVEMVFRGKSIKDDYYVQFDATWLRIQGYSESGSVSELFDIIGKANIQIPYVMVSGRTDIDMELRFVSKGGTTVLDGVGYLRWNDTYDNVVFTPYVYAPERINISFPFATDAKWVDAQHRFDDINLSVVGSDINTTIEFETRLVDFGTIIVGSNGGKSDLYGLDLDNNKLVYGRELIAKIGEISSPDIKIVNDNTDLTSGITAYFSQSYYYGRMPLVELVVTKSGFKEVISPSIKVWGSEFALYPDAIVVETIVNFDSNKVTEKQFNMPQVDNGTNPRVIWLLNLPPGRYQIRMNFPGLHDWNEDPNPMG